MDIADAFEAIKARMKAQWTDLQPDVYLVWPNDPSPDNADLNPFIRMEIHGGAEYVRSFGGQGQNGYRQSGEVIIRVLCRVGTGDKIVRQLSAQAAAIFRGAKFSGCHFSGLAMQAGTSASEDGSWFEVTRIAPFNFDFIA